MHKELVMTRASKKRLPSPSGAGKPAEEIRYAVGQFSLGSILAAFSEKGLVAILIGEDPVQIVRV
jgi:hypothetical protein